MLVALIAACAAVQSEPSTVPVEAAYRAEVWADNWFAMYIGDELVKEDSVPITTERSFNAERFGFDAQPGTVLSFVLKDFKQTDSGLEYIGRRNQQMGDGGFIAQVTHQATDQEVLVSSGDWKCLTIHTAPLNKECVSSPTPDEDCRFTEREAPAGWTDPAFDDSSWAPATVHTKTAVSPKGGYDQINWSPRAQFIWGDDLQSDNTVLCRVTLP